MKKFKILSRKLSYRGQILDFYTNTVQVPNGNQAQWDCIDHRGASAIVAVKDNGNIIMVRQYRGAIDDTMLEIPAGARDSREEEFLTCATRELEEETGYRSESLHHLIDYYSAPAYTSEMIGIFYTETLIPSHQHLDEDEVIQLEEYSLEELVTMIRSGEIKDGKTIAAILAYADLKKK